MDGEAGSRAPADPPRLSLVLPLYNEEASVDRVVTALAAALAARGWPHEIILVVNGSRDGTPARCAALAARLPACRVVTVPVNEGYGNGVLAGLAAARGAWVGFVPGDGQVSPEETCAVAARALAEEGDLVKAARARRADEPLRRVVSVCYNLTLRLFFRVASRDTHGVPKFLRRSDLGRLELRSRDWFLDDEVMIKARAMGWRVVESPVTWRSRTGGRSHVRPGAVLEFVGNLLAWRFWRMRRWRKSVSLRRS